MKSTECKNCIYCVWVVSIGLGVRCSHIENQKYGESFQNSPVVISKIPNNCGYKISKQKMM